MSRSHRSITAGDANFVGVDIATAEVVVAGGANMVAVEESATENAVTGEGNATEVVSAGGAAAEKVGSLGGDAFTEALVDAVG